VKIITLIPRELVYSDKENTNNNDKANSKLHIILFDVLADKTNQNIDPSKRVMFALDHLLNLN